MTSVSLRNAELTSELTKAKGLLGHKFDEFDVIRQEINDRRRRVSIRILSNPNHHGIRP
jgi:hypothetical protein